MCTKVSCTYHHLHNTSHYVYYLILKCHNWWYANFNGTHMESFRSCLKSVQTFYPAAHEGERNKRFQGVMDTMEIAVCHCFILGGELEIQPPPPPPPPHHPSKADVCLWLEYACDLRMLANTKNHIRINAKNIMGQHAPMPCIIWAYILFTNPSPPLNLIDVPEIKTD